MDNEFEYYLDFPVMGAGTPAVIVSPDWDSDTDIDLIETVIRLEDFGPIPIVFEFDEPYPKTPNIVDCFADGGNLVISEKLSSALVALNTHGVQLIPATVSDPRNHKVYEGYSWLHIHNYIECLDKEKSTYTTSAIGAIRMIQKMALDKAVLSNIPLEDRLIFKLGEMDAFHLFHESVVEKIMAVNPTGIRFVKVEDYHIGSGFD
jgi:hypothetical protein